MCTFSLPCALQPTCVLPTHAPVHLLGVGHLLPNQDHRGLRVAALLVGHGAAQLLALCRHHLAQCELRLPQEVLCAWWRRQEAAAGRRRWRWRWRRWWPVMVRYVSCGVGKYRSIKSQDPGRRHVDANQSPMSAVRVFIPCRPNLHICWGRCWRCSVAGWLQGGIALSAHTMIHNASAHNRLPPTAYGRPLPHLF